jgi:hypothetical protein
MAVMASAATSAALRMPRCTITGLTPPAVTYFRPSV